MTYVAPVADMAFALQHSAGFGAALGEGLFGDLSEDVVEAVLEEAGKFAADILAPLNAVGDHHGITLQGRRRHHAAGLARRLSRWSQAGWNALAAPAQFGGQGLPHARQRRLHRNLEAAAMAFGLCPLLTLGAIEALDAHGSDELKQIYLPQARLRRMDRHHAAHRAAGRLRRRRAAHPRRAAPATAATASRAEDLHHLRRPRHDRQHRALRAGAPARCARRAPRASRCS